VYYNLAPISILPGAFLYPMDNYFNLSSTGDDPFAGQTPSSVGTLQLVRSNCFLAYVAPFDGEVVRVNVNSAYSRGYFDQATFDFIIMNNTNNLTPGLTNWSIPYAIGRQMTGYSDQFNGPRSFKAGDFIYCYIVDNNSNYWGNGSLPIPSDNGIFNVTLYLRF
jgi:hypothetical protein